MAPPGTPAAGKNAKAVDVQPAVSVCLGTLQKRTDFLKAARAKRRSTPAFMLQARKRDPGEDRVGIFVGYTCSKKVGNAVIRNRAKRRLREVARAVLPVHGRPGWDYVLIGWAGKTVKHPMKSMCDELIEALKTLHPEQP